VERCKPVGGCRVPAHRKGKSRGDCCWQCDPGSEVVKSRVEVSIHGGGGEVGVTRRAGCLNLQLRLSMIRACVRCA
jgi:hypothetical protein